MPRLVFLFVLLTALGGSACVGPKKGLFPSTESKPVYLAHRGMHVAMVVRREDIPEGAWPAQRVVPESEYIEIGWGDYEGYRLEWTFRIVTRALFWPTPAVILMRGFDEPVVEHFSEIGREIIEVQLSDEGFEEMCRYFESFFQLDREGRPMLVGDDFYLAEGRYHAFRNSNHWVAHALREAGCPITPFYALNANNVMFQARHFGTVIFKR